MKNKKTTKSKTKKIKISKVINIKLPDIEDKLIDRLSYILYSMVAKEINNSDIKNKGKLGQETIIRLAIHLIRSNSDGTKLGAIKSLSKLVELIIKNLDKALIKCDCKVCSKNSKK